VNAAHGHAAGARAITRVGVAIAALTRSSDHSFRIGGDEFVSLLVECTKEQALVYADRVRSAVASTTWHEDQDEVRLTICAGVANFPDDGPTCEQVLGHADEALFRAKDLGKNCVVAYGDARLEARK
jgi:diguanylate cyclase (GGDEF)-like protein